MIDEPRFLKARYDSITRREVVIGIAAGLAAAGLPFRSFAAETLTVADPGGVWTPAADTAFIRPFEKESGVAINHIARQHYPSVEIKANVEAKAYTWDDIGLTTSVLC